MPSSRPSGSSGRPPGRRGGAGTGPRSGGGTSGGRGRGGGPRGGGGGGSGSGCKKSMFPALLLMPYALLRYAFDCMRGRG